MFTERLEEFLHFKELSVYAFEKSIGASKGSISKAIKNKKSIGSNFIESIIKNYPEINAIWLFTGNGKMTNEDNLENVLNQADKVKIINHIHENLEDYRYIRSFQLLLESAKGDDELSGVKEDIENLYRKVAELTRLGK